MEVKLMIMGRSYDASERLPDHITLADGASVADALVAVSDMLGDDQPLPASGLLVVSGRHLGTVSEHPNDTLQPGDELVIIAPVAGG